MALKENCKFFKSKLFNQLKYMGRRCDGCKQRMWNGWKFGPREGNTMHRPAYCPDCLPEDLKAAAAGGGRGRNRGGRPA